MLAIWPGVRPNSPLSTGISGAQANHAKKQTKNAIQVRWKARICGVLKLSSSMRVALPVIVTCSKKQMASREPAHRWSDEPVQGTPLS
ncbi:hypothetical protein D9M72_577050 [compost metagenome]